MGEFGIIHVQIERNSEGLYFATSEDLAGVCVAHRNLDAIVEDMPNVIKLWFKRNKNAIVEVFEAPILTQNERTSYRAIPVAA